MREIKINKTLKVFKFEELEEQAQRKVINNFREDPYENDSYWNNYITEDQGAFLFKDKKEIEVFDLIGAKPNSIGIHNEDKGAYYYSFNELKPYLHLRGSSTYTYVSLPFFFNEEELYEEHIEGIKSIENTIEKWITHNEYMSEEYIKMSLEDDYYEFLEDGTPYNGEWE